MKPYRLIKGKASEIELFEQQVSEALEEGYEFSNELSATSLVSSSGETDVLLLQALVYDDIDPEDSEELEGSFEEDLAYE